MSSTDKNLSDLNYNLSEDPSELKIVVVHSEWNEDITNRLLEGCMSVLEKIGVSDNPLSSLSVPELQISSTLLLPLLFLLFPF